MCPPPAEPPGEGCCGKKSSSGARRKLVSLQFRPHFLSEPATLSLRETKDARRLTRQRSSQSGIDTNRIAPVELWVTPPLYLPIAATRAFRGGISAAILTDVSWTDRKS